MNDFMEECLQEAQATGEQQYHDEEPSIDDNDDDDVAQGRHGSTWVGGGCVKRKYEEGSQVQLWGQSTTKPVGYIDYSINYIIFVNGLQLKQVDYKGYYNRNDKVD